jgi:hypothetical protein
VTTAAGELAYRSQAICIVGPDGSFVGDWPAAVLSQFRPLTCFLEAADGVDKTPDDEANADNQVDPAVVVSKRWGARPSDGHPLFVGPSRSRACCRRSNRGARFRLSPGPC